MGGQHPIRFFVLVVLGVLKLACSPSILQCVIEFCLRGSHPEFLSRRVFFARNVNEVNRMFYLWCSVFTLSECGNFKILYFLDVKIVWSVTRLYRILDITVRDFLFFWYAPPFHRLRSGEFFKRTEKPLGISLPHSRRASVVGPHFYFYAVLTCLHCAGCRLTFMVRGMQSFFVW